MAAIASAAMRNSQAAPRDSRTASRSRGRICGSTTRSTICHVLPPRVWALTISSRGSSRVRCCRSRTMNGAMPKTMSTTFDTSSRPKTTNRTGRIAIGGISDSPSTNGERPARTSGMAPSATPKARPTSALIPTPSASRRRLAPVSAHSSTSPVRLSGSTAIRCTASPRLANDGSSLSFGFSASRAPDATR